MVQEMTLCIADNENNRDLLRVAYSELGDRIHWEQGKRFHYTGFHQNGGNPSSKGLFGISNRLT